jgi:hypothetical protein
MNNKNKLILVIIVGVILFGIAIFLLILNFYDNNKRVENEQNIKVTSNEISEIPGGVYYGEGFNITQVKKTGEEPVFNLFITDQPFNENVKKALDWLKSKGLDLDRTNYTCSPSIYIKASEEEIKNCTHLINK